jgi:hypothetical protein
VSGSAVQLSYGNQLAISNRLKTNNKPSVRTSTRRIDSGEPVNLVNLRISAIGSRLTELEKALVDI